MIPALRRRLRFLNRNRRLLVTSVATLGVAIGAATAVFGVIDKVLIRPLPIDEPDRIAVVWLRDQINAGSLGEFSYPAFRAWQRETRAFETLAAMGSVNWSLVLRDGDAVTVPVAAVSASFFPLLGTLPALGRTLTPEDDARGAARVAVMSHRMWASRFASDPAVVGRALRFDDGRYTIVGVMPEGFDYPRGTELWVPAVPQLADASTRAGVDLLNEPGIGLLYVLGRVRPGGSFSAARDEATSQLAEFDDPLFRRGFRPLLTPLDEHIFGRTRTTLLALAASVGVLLLIACANVAVMLLARATAQAGQIATRLAIGATRRDIVRQSVAEAFVLAFLATATGLLIASWATEVLVAIAPAEALHLDTVRMDIRAFAFAALLCVITTFLVGLAPGMHGSRGTLSHAVGLGSSLAAESHPAQRMFVVCQVSMTLVLLVCGGLVVQSFLNLLRVDLGFEPADTLTLDVTIKDVPVARYNAFYTELLERIDAMPQVTAAGAVFLRPLEHTGIGSDVPVLIEGQRATEPAEWQRHPGANFESITPGYFRAIGTRLLRGRTFTSADTGSAAPVAIVSAGLAQRLWPGQDPVGRRILPRDTPRLSPNSTDWPIVVGVVEDARYRGIADLRFDLFVPFLQRPDAAVKHLMVRTTHDPLSLVAAIRAEATRLEPEALVERAGTMEQQVARAMAPWRFGASTLGFLSLVALVLAALGVYAMASQSVEDRRWEIGLRMAVGARPGDVVRLVLHQGWRVIGAGIVIGLTASVAVGRLLMGLLYEVTPVDVPTFAGVSLLFVAISTAAMLGPAWQAAHVDPALTLKQQ